MEILNDITYNLSNLNETDNKIEQSNTSKIKLFQHQKTILYAISEIEKTHKISFGLNGILETNIAILSDKVGSGKTYDIIYLIENLPKPHQYKEFTSYQTTQYMNVYFKSNYDIYYPNLIIVPHSLIPQWLYVIKLTDLKYLLLRFESDFKKFNYQEIPNNDIILVSSKMINQFTLYLDNEKNWCRIIIDEPHMYTINPDRLNANFLWFLCATPDELFTSNRKLFKNFIGKANYESLPWKYKKLLCIQNNYEYIDKSIVLPKIEKIYINCLTPTFLGYFRNTIPSNAIDLLNAGQVNEAIKLLNCNVDTSDNIIQTLTKLYDNKLHNIERRIDYLNSLFYSNENDKQERLQPVLLEKCKIEDKIKGIKERLLKFNHENCPVCIDKFKMPVASNCCNNIFCMECLLECMKRNSKCPFCRSTIKTSNLHLINNDIKIKNTENKKENKLSKNKQLLKLLKESNSNKKFLVCSKYDSVFFEISKQLDDNNISYKILNGSSQRISNIINNYKLGKLKVILLNSNNFGSGLNLQMTTDIIIYHKLSKSMEEQVIGRAQRIGRENSLKVTYLQFDHEYD